MNFFIGVHLSEQSAARLEAAARRSGATKSALIEAALDHFLDFDDDIDDAATVSRRLTRLSRQLEQLDRDLKVVNETVALHARFHLAVTPPMPGSELGPACTIGSERFEEFAAQVGRRIHLGTSLMRETMDRPRAKRPDFSRRDLEEGGPPGATSAGYEPGVRASTGVDEASEHIAAVREDGSSGGFPERTGGPLH
jgi:predicted DNA-binding protein